MSDPDPGAELTATGHLEGWGLPPSSPKWHWFPAGEVLSGCGKRMFFRARSRRPRSRKELCGVCLREEASQESRHGGP